MAWGLKNDSDRDERYVKLPAGITRVRFLNDEPSKKWTHWIGRTPFNCPGKNAGCPACAERTRTNNKDLYRLQKTGLSNVLVYKEGGEPEVRILAYGSQLGTALETLVEEYGEIRNYDVKIKKTKDGSRDWDVNYTATAPKDDFWKPEYDSYLADRFDLDKECEKATNADISAAMRAFQSSEAAAAAGDGDDDEDAAPAAAQSAAPAETKASAATLAALEKAIKACGPDLDFVDFGIDRKTVSSEEAMTYIAQLKAKPAEVPA